MSTSARTGSASAPEVDYDKTLASVQEVVEGYPGIFRDVQTYLRERIREVLTGTSEAVVVRISGDDLEVLREAADEVRRSSHAIPGLVDLHVELQDEIPQIEVETDLAAARRYGVKPGDVRRAAAALMQSIEVNDIWKPAQGLRRERLEHSRDAPQLDEHS